MEEKNYPEEKQEPVDKGTPAKPAGGRVYLTLPRLKKEEFGNVLKEIKEKGARFDTVSKRWYIRPGQEVKFQEYLQPAQEAAEKEPPAAIQEEKIYLKLPRMGREEFGNLLGEIKGKGARFDAVSKRWYIHPGQEENFQEYLQPAQEAAEEEPPAANQEEKIYLKLPKMEMEEFYQVIEELKEKGAYFDEAEKKWYIHPGQEENFQEYLQPAQEAAEEEPPAANQKEKIYLKLPKMEMEEFYQVIEELKEKGAHFDGAEKKWYIHPDQEESFREYLQQYREQENINKARQIIEKNLKAIKLMYYFNYTEDATSFLLKDGVVMEIPNEDIRKKIGLLFPDIDYSKATAGQECSAMSEIVLERVKIIETEEKAFGQEYSITVHNEAGMENKCRICFYGNSVNNEKEHSPMTIDGADLQINFKEESDDVIRKKVAAYLEERERMEAREEEEVKGTAEEKVEETPDMEEETEQIRSPGGYRTDETGHSQRLWHGKTVEEFTQEDRLHFLAEREVVLEGKLSEETAAHLKEQGYTYEDGQLKKLQQETPQQPMRTFYVPEFTTDKQGFKYVGDVKKIEGIVLAENRDAEDVMHYTVNIEDGSSIEICSNQMYTEEQAAVLQEAKRLNLSPREIDLFANPRMDARQMEAIRAGFADGLHFDQLVCCTDISLSAQKIEILKDGMIQGADMRKIALLAYDGKDMTEEAYREKVNGLVKESRQKIAMDVKKGREEGIMNYKIQTEEGIVNIKNDKPMPIYETLTAQEFNALMKEDENAGTGEKEAYREKISSLLKEKENRQKIAMDMKKHGYQATKGAVDKIARVNSLTNKNNNCIDIFIAAKEGTYRNTPAEEAIKEVMKEFQQQKKMKMEQAKMAAANVPVR